MGYSPWGHKESDTTERLTHTHTHTHTHQREKHAPLLRASVTKPHEVQIPVPLLLASTWTFLGLFCVPRGLM